MAKLPRKEMEVEFSIFPITLQHVDRRSQRSNHRPYDLTFMWDQAEESQKTLGSSKYTCLLDVLTNGKMAEAHGHNHYAQTSTADLNTNIWTYFKLDNHTTSNHTETFVFEIVAD